MSAGTAATGHGWGVWSGTGNWGWADAGGQMGLAARRSPVRWTRAGNGADRTSRARPAARRCVPRPSWRAFRAGSRLGHPGRTVCNAPASATAGKEGEWASGQTAIQGASRQTFSGWTGGYSGAEGLGFKLSVCNNEHIGVWWPKDFGVGHSCCWRWYKHVLIIAGCRNWGKGAMMD